MLLDSCEECGTEERAETMRARSQCLMELAAMEVSAPGRNWYRTEDLVMTGLVIRPSKEARLARIPVLEARPAVGTTRLCSDLSWVMMEPAP